MAQLFNEPLDRARLKRGAPTDLAPLQGGHAYGDEVTSLTIYVAYHASGPHPQNQATYRAICNVGPDGTRPTGFSHYDVENGLPDRNAAYCELSPLHALAAEATTEWLGLAHYRRLLVSPRGRGEPDRYPGFRRVREFDWNHLARAGAAPGQVLEALEGAEWASSVRLDVRRLGFTSLWDQYTKTHDDRQIAVADDLARASGPSLPLFSDYLRRETSLRPFNMMVGRAHLVREYLEWLWPVIDGAYQHIGNSSGRYERRWPGFLAERLLNYWLDVVHGGVRERALPVLLLHDARIQNSAHPKQGEHAGRSRPRANRVVARALSALPAPVVLPLAREELQRAGRSFHARD